MRTRARVAAVAVLLMLALCGDTFAATTTVVPNGTVASHPSWVEVSCVTTPHTCIDEVLPGTFNDGDYLTNNVAGPVSDEFDLTTVAGVGRVTMLELRVRGACSSGAIATLDVGAYLSGGTQVGTTQTLNFLGATPTTTSAVIPGPTLTQANLDGLRLRITGEGCTLGSTQVTAAAVGVTYGNVGGVARDAAGAAWGPCDGVTTNVGVVVNGGAPTYVSCDDATGSYASTATWTAGQTVTTFLNDNAAGGDGATYRVPSTTSATPMTMDLDEGRVRLEAGNTLTNALVTINDAVDDGDIPVTTTAGPALTYGGLLVVGAGATYTPGQTVTAQRLAIGTGATYSAGATTLVLIGSGTASCATPLTARPFCNSGTFTQATSTVRYTGNAATAIAGGTFATLQLQPTSGTPTYDLGAPGATSFTITTLTIGNGTHAVTASTTSQSPSITVTGATSIAASATLSGTNASGTFSPAGGISGNGDVQLANSTTLVSLTAATSFSANGTGTAWEFGTLHVTNASGVARALTLTSASRAFQVNTLLRTASTSGATTLTASAAGTGITVLGDVQIDASTTFTAPTPAATRPLRVDGNFTNAGTFTPGSGVVTFAGAGTSVISRTGAGNFYRVTSTTPGKVVELASNITITNQLNLSGQCALPVTLRSSVAATQRTITSAGMTPSITNAEIRDIATSTAINAANATNLGGNSNITFAAGPVCAAPTNTFVDAMDAANGLATTVAGALPFPISTVNQSGGTVDRQRTRVMSTPTDNVVALYHLDTLTNPTADEWHAVSAVPGAPDLFTDQGWFAPTYGVDPGPPGHGTGIDIPQARYLQSSMGASTAVFDAQTYTVELWFKTSSIDNSDSDPHPILIERGNWWQNQKFSIQFDKANMKLIASISNGSAEFPVTTSAAPYVDDTWHHVALTVIADADLPGPGEMRLYVDGNERAMRTFTGAQNNYAGITNNQLTIGISQNGATSAYIGELDEIRFSDVARTEDEIRGYLAAQQPHMRTMWQTASGTGDALAPTCATATRCADVAYGGPALVDEGRWYAQQQLRTPGGTWSAWSTPAPFETRSAITVSASGPMAFGSVLSGSNTPASTTATINCGAATGCDLFATAYSDNVALDDGGLNTIPRHSPASPIAPSAWAAGTADGLGISVASTTSGKDTSRWGTGTLPTDTTTLFYQGMSRTPSLLASTSAPGVESVVIAGRLNIPPTTAVASYTGLLSIIAVPNI